MKSKFFLLVVMMMIVGSVGAAECTIQSQSDEPLIVMPEPRGLR